MPTAAVKDWMLQGWTDVISTSTAPPPPTAYRRLIAARPTGTRFLDIRT